MKRVLLVLSLVLSALVSWNHLDLGFAQSSAFTHKPSDGTTIIDCAFTNLQTWPTGCNWDTTLTNSTNHAIDGTAPLDSGHVLTECVTEPSGPNYSIQLDSVNAMIAGNAGGWRSVYVAFYHKHDFTTSSNNANKMFYLQTAQTQGFNAEILGNYGLYPGNGWNFDPDTQDPTMNNCQVQGANITPYCSDLQSNGGNNLPINVWNKVELYVLGSTTGTSQNGVVKIWINDVQQKNVSNVNWPAVNGNGFQNVQITNTISSLGFMPPNQTSCQYFNHFFVSVNGSTPGGGGGSTVPPAPTGIAVQ